MKARAPLPALLLGLLPALLLGLPACQRTSPAPSPDAESPDAEAPDLGPPDASAPDWLAITAADEQCADCHPDIVEAWRRRPMGQSWTRGADFTAPPGQVTHPLSGLTYTARPVDGAWQFEDGQGPARVADQIVGSGAHTRSFIWSSGGVMRLMPLTWYPEAERWDLSPGYAVADHPGFQRAISEDCLTCHANPLPTVAGSEIRFTTTTASALSCSRCHGDGRPHVAAMLSGEGEAQITNPGDLPPALAADVCHACHLQGELRLLRSGRRWADLTPGQPLSETVAVFGRAGGDDFKIVSQGSRLPQSRCAQGAKDALQCATCHPPHPTGPIADRAAPCRQCHQVPEATRCPDPAAAEPQADCVRCHMVKAGTSDIPHVQMTDHLIRRRPTQSTEGTEGPLLWLNRPADLATTAPEALRLLGRAYAEAHRQSGRPSDRAEARRLLEAHLQPSEDAEGWFDLASMRRLDGDLTGALAAVERALQLGPPRSRWLAAAADLRVASGDLAGGLKALDAALAIDPQIAARWARRGAILMSAGDQAGALAALDRSATLDPRAADPHLIRAAMARLSGDLTEALGHLRRGVRVDPSDAQAWLTLCRALLDARHAEARPACDQARRLATGPAAAAHLDGALARWHLQHLSDGGDAATAAQLAQRALTADTHNADGLTVHSALALAGGDAATAAKLAQRAVTADPMSAEAWWRLAEALKRRGDASGAATAVSRAKKLGW